MTELKERYCKSCSTTKLINEFTKDKYDKTGYTYTCTKCRSLKNKEYYLKNPEKAKIKNEKQKENRKRFYSSPEGILSSRKAHLKAKYGITLEEYNEKLQKQNGKCAICQGTETHDKHGVLAVDHDHKTGKIRDLLCFKCNAALGGFNDNKIILQKAIKYLEKYESTNYE